MTEQSPHEGTLPTILIRDGGGGVFHLPAEHATTITDISTWLLNAFESMKDDKIVVDDNAGSTASFEGPRAPWLALDLIPHMFPNLPK